MSNRNITTVSAVTFTLASLVLNCPVTLAVTTLDSSHPVSSAAAPLDPITVMGNESCVKCHAAEIQVWKTTPHNRTFEELHRRPEAKAIATKLGLQSIKNEGRCVACHYTEQSQAGGDPHVIAGVSCESCHGGAKNWLDLHQDYGGEGITRLSESPEHRQARILKSVAAGMRNPANVYSVAQSCLRCHTTADEQLVNVGGHSAGSLEFEFVSWSQGTIRHNFVRSDGKTNDVSDTDRLRVMFVAGMIAELESSLRATAVATEKATYGVTVAKRGARAGARLKSVAAKVESPKLDEILAVFGSVTLKLNNRDDLIQAADKISVLGYQFAETVDGSTFGSLDSFIPSSDRYK
ncbi:cytochrome c family protein [Rubripirellula reticaptiva]|uniref:Perchlorate reductase subunit gamma n=1 Tax=Rubripirellula reticaptiva TaxID=2528013 RepID=A0A5C6FBS6_9BACT|nr:cytochrome c family protein [Rubripirellula reticaptiva]TWU58242.1 Perchlorate reductase subunit gamma precursor [Rubripirellula reticaptiva]